MGNPVSIIKDTLPVGVNIITKEQEAEYRKRNIPVFKGRLFEVDDYGNAIFKAENTVVLGGAITALEHLFGVNANFIPADLNTIYGLNTDVRADRFASYITLFGVGTGGSAIDFGNVYDPKFTQREIIDFVPFRLADTDTLEGPDAEKYFFRRQISNTPTKYAWYLKEFEKPVEIKSQWKDAPEPDADGTEIIDEVYDDTTNIGIESIGECLIKITPEDIRPYFEFNGNIEMARYNSVGLFIGKKVQISANYYDYVNVRLFSVVNLENDSVKRRKEVTYLYRVYAAV